MGNIHDNRHVRFKSSPLYVSKKAYVSDKSSMHVHDVYEIVLIEQGNYKVYAPKLVHEGSGPCIMFFKYGVYHDVSRINSASLTYVAHVMQFKQTVFDSMLQHPIYTEGHLNKAAIVIPIDNDTLARFIPVLERLERLSREVTQESPMFVVMRGYFSTIINYVYEFILEGKTISFDVEYDENFYITDVIRAIVDNIEEGRGVSITEFAEQFHVSSTKLSRDFDRMTGMSMKQMVTSLRLERVKNMLADGKSNIEVAEKCGFSNCDYLIQFFNKHMNMSPGAYRKLKSEKKSKR